MVMPGETIGTGAPRGCPECRMTPPLEVFESPAGYYIGTYCDCGPYSRESDYYKTRKEAEDALKSGIFGR